VASAESGDDYIYNMSRRLQRRKIIFSFLLSKEEKNPQKNIFRLVIRLVILKRRKRNSIIFFSLGILKKRNNYCFEPFK